MKCKSCKAITVKDRKQFPKTLTTAQACETVKLAAKLQRMKNFFVPLSKKTLLQKSLKCTQNALEITHAFALKKHHHWKVVQSKKNKIQ